MTEDSPKTPQNNPSEGNQITPLIPNNPTDKIIESEKSKREPTDDGYNKCKSDKPIIVKMEKSKGWKRAEIISIISILFTASLFYMNIKSFEKTKRAVEISEENLKDARKKDAANVVSQHKIDSLDSIVRARDYVRDTTNIALSKLSLNAQINSVKETQKQFQAENEPYLQIDNVEMYIEAKPNFSAVSYYIHNLGKQPVKLTYGGSGFGFASPKDVEKISVKNIFSKKLNVGNKNIYITNSNPKRRGEIINWITLDSEQIKFMQDNNYQGIQYGEYKYINLVTNTKKTYRFIIAIDLPPKAGVTWIYNKNTID